MRLTKGLIDKIIQCKCSRTDIKIIFYLLLSQQENGCSYNVYSTALCNELGIVQPTFSRRLKKLTQNGIIKKCTGAGKGYYHITLSDYSDYTEGHYITIHREIFSEDFFKLKATEIYTMLQILLRDRDNQNKIECNESTIAKYANIRPDNKRAIKRIVKSLKNLLCHSTPVLNVESCQGNTERKHIFKVLQGGKNTTSTQNYTHQKYKMQAFLNRYKIKYSKKDLTDLIQLGCQYSNYVAIVNAMVREVCLNHKAVKGAIIRSLIEERITKLQGRTSSLFAPLR